MTLLPDLRSDARDRLLSKAFMFHSPAPGDFAPKFRRTRRRLLCPTSGMDALLNGAPGRPPRDGAFSDTPSPRPGRQAVTRSPYSSIRYSARPFSTPLRTGRVAITSTSARPTRGDAGLHLPPSCAAWSARRSRCRAPARPPRNALRLSAAMRRCHRLRPARQDDAFLLHLAKSPFPDWTARSPIDSLLLTRRL